MARSTGNESILVVDDAPNTLEVLERNLSAEGYRVFSAPGVSEAISILESTQLDLVITDLKMPKVSGLDLVRHVRENYKDIGIMMITGYATIEGAVEAVKSGAEEYLSKPFTDEELLSAVRKTLEKMQVRRAARAQPPIELKLSHDLIGESVSMQEVFDAIQKAASTPATILITGESGTGKELVARAIHYNSDRASAPFVPVNCGGIPEGLLESELFGHVKGAFTGAAVTRAGFFQTADGGTIFLDEISETSLAMQVKLMRVLQDKEVYMVGATKSRKVNVRILAATNKHLHSLIKKGTFREDLFFRLNVINIHIPPLRERREDILPLVTYFSGKYAREMGKPALQFSDNALDVLSNYYWPGNVRELENVIQRIVVMSEGDKVEVPDLPALMRFSALRTTGLNRTLAEVEAEYIRNVLASVKGNKTKAAKILDIDRKTLREKLKEKGDEPS
ncbi:MAG: sigma-54-dependent Fis family transcriptional regulator [bacterium]|nr:MAG: sigma-54-dependent Fis family transcriptional regulator [bacterium]